MAPPRIHPSRRNYAPLTLAECVRDVRLPEDFLSQLGVTELPGQGVAVAFYDGRGQHRADIVWSSFTGMIGWPEKTPALPYGLWQLPQARHARALFLVPLAVDCWTLWYHGVPALALPAVAGLEREHLCDVETIFVTPGQPRWCPLFVSQVEAKLMQLEFPGRAYSLRLTHHVTSVADVHKEFAEQLRDKLALSVTEGKPLRRSPMVSAGPDLPPSLPAFDPVPAVPIGISSTAEAAPTPETAEQNRLAIAAKRYVNVGILACDIKPMKLEWLMPGRIPMARPTVLDGDPDLGKSLLSIDLVARLTRGRPMPGEDETRNGELGARNSVEKMQRLSGGALLLVKEDNLHDTVRVRLETAGADLERVIIVNQIPRQNRPPRLPEDIPFLKQAMERVEAKLVVIDPLAAFLGPDVVLGHESAIRRVLDALDQLALDTGAAMLLLRHLAKAWRWNPLYRGAGSMALVTHCRSALWLAPDPEHERKRVLAVTKSNLADKPPSLSLSVTGQGITWHGESTWTDKTLMQVGRSTATVLPEALDFLRAALADSPKPGRDILQNAQSLGISSCTLRRAKKLLDVQHYQEHGENGQRWLWRMQQRPAEGKEPEPPMEHG